MKGNKLPPRNEAMTPGPVPATMLEFDLDAVRTRDDSWTGQVLVNGAIILESEGNHSRGQAIANAQDDFILFIRWAVDQFEAAMEAESERPER
jgi:hypothetical protein